MIFLNEKEAVSYYPNKETRIIISKEDLDKAREAEEVAVAMMYRSDADLVSLMLVTRYLQEQLGDLMKDSKLLISYLPYSRMDRKEKPDTAFTLEYVADFINSLNYGRVGIVSPHSEVSTNKIKKSFAVQFEEEILHDSDFNPKKDIIIFPDESAKERFLKDLSLYNKEEIVCFTAKKQRDFETGKITSLNLNFDNMSNLAENTRFFIVDDIVSYGGTAIRTAKIIRDYFGEEYEIILAVTHSEQALLQGSILMRKTDEKAYINKVVTTNTLFNDKEFYVVNSLKKSGALKILELKVNV